jgi:hypothetical protein
MGLPVGSSFLEGCIAPTTKAVGSSFVTNLKPAA